mmetsp:Transcript_11467/g.13875  ORF Transcript_11467/g.13875 Transcript_11467/m.13875 type:complete len:198 (+) Transcript_11467:130-723(+)|eukprot:CAMPEP_0195325976 /NCGR_PEP_ID=MMETSP0708-20121125/9443_1 /TAXON_ID=33640 /ORGANISM="Asterionellopsis glacialis, Strain CCMP134" /LENGTH=197 /DNA_ID=CAMNT_0040393527 /DNA_START=130 /DNA_END=723 /DNA_ORIENTATION=-
MPSALVVKHFVPAYAKHFVPALATLAGRAGFERFSLFPARAFARRPLVVYTPGFLWRESAIAFPEFKRISPHYEITDTNEEFKVSVTVPKELKADDITVNIKNDFLTMTGETKTEEEDYKSHFKFMQSFSLDPAIDKDKFEASLKDGELRIKAPKDPEKVDIDVQKIPVIELENTKAQQEKIDIEHDMDAKNEESIA